MDSAQVAAAYDNLAERWLDEQFGNSDGIAQHQRALRFLEPAAGGWALNAGCGCNTRLHRLLRTHGLRCEGVDVSPRMVELARDRDPDLIVHRGDLRAWTPPRRYRFITGWDSLWHVALADQPALMAKLMDALEPGGVFVFSTGGLDAPSEHIDASMGPELYYATPGIPGLLALTHAAGCRLRHLEFDQPGHLHLYMIVQRDT